MKRPRTAMTSLWRTGWVTILCLLLIVPQTSTQIYEGQCELDLIFLVDSGTSTGNSNFRRLLNAISDYISTEFPVAEEAVHVGVIAFSTTADVVHLSGDLDAVLEGIRDLPYQGRYTYTHAAFKAALHDLQSSSRALTASQVVILFTDDAAGISYVAKEAANDLRNIGVDIWSVGIGARAPSDELYNFTGGNHDRVILTRSYDAVPEAIDLPVACTVYYPPEPPSTTTSALEGSLIPQAGLGTTSHVSDKESSATDVSMIAAATTENNLKTDLLTTSLGGNIAVTSNLNDRRTDLTSYQPTTALDIAHTEASNSMDNRGTDRTTIQPTTTLDIGHTETASIQDLNTTPISPGNHITDQTTNLWTASIATALVETVTDNEGVDTTNTMNHLRIDRTTIYPTATLDLHHTETAHIQDSSSTRNSIDNHITVRPTATQDGRHTTDGVSHDVRHTEDFRTTQTQTPAMPTSIHTMSYSASWHVTPIDSTPVTPSPPPSLTSGPVPGKIFKDLLCSKAEEIEGLWLASHPTDCDKFVQCHFGNESQLTTAVRLCPRGLFWSKAVNKCTDPIDADCPMDPCRDDEVDTYNMDGGCGLYWRCLGRVSHGESCKRGYAYTALEGCIPSPRCKTVSIADETCGNEGPCQRMPLPGNRAYQTMLRAIPGEWISTPCLYGGTFDMASCSCLNSRPFTSDCQHIEKIELQNETDIEERSTSLVFDPTSSRPTALRFRYKPSPTNDEYDERGEILMRSSECSMGGLFVLWEEEDFLETRVFSRDGYFLKASLPLHGLNTTDWRTVDLRLTFSGDLSVKLKSEHLTFTNYIEGGLHLPVSLCGWDAGLPGSLAEQVSPFQGDMEEIYISRCYDHGF